MRAVLMKMGKKRVAVGAVNIILTLFILLLLQFLSQCLSSSTTNEEDEDAFSAKRTANAVNNLMQEISAPQLWPRRMLSSVHSSVVFSNPWHHTNYRQLLEGANTGPKHGSTPRISTTDMAVSKDNSEKFLPRGEVKPQSDHQDFSSSSSAHRAGNSSTIDPRYGVEKRLVPTGPNPLHN